jgi:flagella basal body P-ring formation protein FlgA
LDAAPDLDLGASPLPGLTRTFRADQPFGGTCFTLGTAPLTQQAIETTMRKAFSDVPVRIEILEFSRVSIPDSVIEFLPSTLSHPPALDPDAAVLWRGRAVSRTRHSQPIWARVKVSVEVAFLIASREISAGSVLEEADLAAATAWQFPSMKALPSKSAAVIGLAATRRIPIGAIIDQRTLIAPSIVATGQMIDIRVLGGTTQLRTSAIAERGGKLGEIILVKNDQSGKRFRAKVTGPGQAVVLVPERN